jgi:hypothetical protein
LADSTEKGGPLNQFNKFDGATKTSFEPVPTSILPLDSGLNSAALIRFNTEVAGVPLSDCFLWPRACRSVLQIKLFAVELLSDLAGPKFGAFDPREIECK